MEKKSRNKLIALIIFAILTTAFCVIFIIGGTKVNNDDYVVFGVIGLMIFLTYSIWEIISTIRKQKPNDIEILKTNLANYAFDNLLKEGEHYTVRARVENNVLVKKIVRWAYCDKNGKGINAVFSIETDKGLYCFQVKGNSVYMIETDVCTSIYPSLLPIDDSNDNKNKPTTNQQKSKVNYGEKIKDLMDFDFDFGDFGVVAKENIDIDDIPRLEVDNEKSVEYSLSKAKEWAEKVKQHKNYFVNYFLYMMLLDVNDRDSQFWENYRANVKEFSNEDCQRIFDETFTEDFNKSLDKHLKVGATKCIGDIIKDKFKFFNYEQFVKGITLRIMITKNNHLCLSLSDKFNDVFCEAFEEFDENLEGLDYHNF